MQPPAHQPCAHLTPAAVAALHALRASLTNTPTSWFANEDPCGGQAKCGNSDPARPCAWAGISCNARRVTDIILPCSSPFRCYNLEGSLPGALAGARELRTIVLQGNNIGEHGCQRQSRAAGDSWPATRCCCGQAGARRTLLLPSPPPLLPLSLWPTARAGGTLPAEWGQLQWLTELFLGGNKLTGTLQVCCQAAGPGHALLGACRLWQRGPGSRRARLAHHPHHSAQLRGGCGTSNCSTPADPPLPSPCVPPSTHPMQRAWGTLKNLEKLDLGSNNLGAPRRCARRLLALLALLPLLLCAPPGRRACCRCCCSRCAAVVPCPASCCRGRAPN